MKFVLTYEINDYADCGGGQKTEYFDEAEEMHARVEQLLKPGTVGDDGKEYYQNIEGFEVRSKFAYEPVQVVTKVVARQQRC